MFFLRQEGRTRISTPPQVTPETTVVDGAPPQTLFDQTTATITEGASVLTRATYDSGRHNGFNIGAAAAARVTGRLIVSYAANNDVADLDNSEFCTNTFNSGTSVNFGDAPCVGRYLRMTTVLNGSAAFVWLGTLLSIPRGIGQPFVLPNLSATFSTTETNTKVGQVLGARAQPTPTTTVLSMNNLSPVFFEQFEPTRLHLAQGRPCFLIPDVNKPSVTGLIQAAGTVGAPQHRTPQVASLSIPIRWIP